MSTIKQKFYNLFWQNKSCQNIFLLSKEELLESIDIGSSKSPYSYYTNKIIISNANHQKETVETIKYRTENHNIDLESSLEIKLNQLEPIFISFFKSRYGKSVEKLFGDLSNDPTELFTKIFSLFDAETNKEEVLISLFQQYNFIPPTINSFKDIEKSIEEMFTPSKKNELINEKNIKIFLEGLKFIKEIYVNQNYKRLYSTNQILVNSLFSSDDFMSRIEMFSRLYEAEVIKPSLEDAFIECSHCDPHTYRGTFQLKLSPKKLERLKCPVCTESLTYFVPYQLHEDIYEIVKEQDGLLHNALCELLDNNKIRKKTNEKFLKDIEIDCFFLLDNKTFLIETKMYKLNTTPAKLKSKIRKHFSDLHKVIVKLNQADKKYEEITGFPILLVNISDEELLKKIEIELKEQNEDQIFQSIAILNITQFRKQFNF